MVIVDMPHMAVCEGCGTNVRLDADDYEECGNCNAIHCQTCVDDSTRALRVTYSPVLSNNILKDWVCCDYCFNQRHMATGNTILEKS